MRFAQLLGVGSRRRSGESDGGTDGAKDAKLGGSTTEPSVSDPVPMTFKAEKDFSASWRDPSTFASEAERLSLLQSLHVLQTGPEHRFDCITR